MISDRQVFQDMTFVLFMCFMTSFKGEKIKSELSALVKDLPAVYDRVAESSKGLQKTIEYYQDFTSFVTDRLVLFKSLETHDVIMTSDRRRCDVMTSHRR